MPGVAAAAVPALFAYGLPLFTAAFGEPQLPQNFMDAGFVV